MLERLDRGAADDNGANHLASEAWDAWGEDFDFQCRIVKWKLLNCVVNEMWLLPREPKRGKGRTLTVV